MKRRKFLSVLSSAVGSAVLAACGGGGSDPTNPAAKDVASTGGLVAPAPASGASAAGAASAASAATVGGSVAASGGTNTSPATTPSTPVTTPSDPGNPTTVPPAPVAKKMFYGINGHYDYTYSPAQTISMLTAIGCTSYRITVEDLGNSLSKVAAMAKAFDGTGMTLFVCLDPSLYDNSGQPWANEQLAYNEGFNYGSTSAKSLQPYGIVFYECGNELTRRDLTVIDSTCAGNKASDFNNAYWPIMRGLMRGMIDGVKSVQSTAKCGINFCVADIGASDALWFGTQPDGSSGHTPLRWDVTTWHNYQVYGDIFNIGTDGAGPGFDLPAYCKKQYGVPFMITEWNANPEVSQADRAAYITTNLQKYYNNRKADNIEAVFLYELDSGNTTWGMVIDGVPNQLPYNAMKNFIAANPDN